MRSTFLTAAVLAGALIGSGWIPVFGQTLIVGNDEKNGVDQNFKPIIREPGHDTLSVIDISNPGAPRITATIPLINSVVGPPTNLAIVPPGDIALVANSLMPVIQGWGHRLEPDDKVFIVDLKASPPKVIGTVMVGKQPSGMAVSPNGDLALVANRADGTISVLSIHGSEVPGRRYRVCRRRRRSGLGRRHHPGREARACGQSGRQQGGAAGHRRRQGHLY